MKSLKDTYLEMKQKELEEATVRDLENEVEETYQSQSVGMRRALEQVWLEAASKQTAGATPPEALDSKESGEAKKFAKDSFGTPKVDDTEEKGHDDASRAGRATSVSPKRHNDQ